MNRIDRLTAILIQLQTKRWITASEIADRYDVSLRTIYRDIRSLEEGGVPIGAEAGKGYYLVDGYHLPPVMFTREEAGAMLIAGKLMDKLSDKSLQTAYAAAIDKIKSILPPQERDSLEGLNDQVLIYHQQQDAGANYPNNFLLTIQKALMEGKCLEIDYHAGYNLQKTKARTIDPHGLIYYGNAWHLIAYCKLREDMRDFRLDRMQDVRTLSDCASPKNPHELKNYLKNHWETIQLIEVKVWFHESVLSALNPSKYYFGYIDEEKTDDGALLTFAISDLHAIASWLMSFRKLCRVISPDELHEEIIKTVRELAELYLEEVPQHSS